MELSSNPWHFRDCFIWIIFVFWKTFCAFCLVAHSLQTEFDEQTVMAAMVVLSLDFSFHLFLCRGCFAPASSGERVGRGWLLGNTQKMNMSPCSVVCLMCSTEDCANWRIVKWIRAPGETGNGGTFLLTQMRICFYCLMYLRPVMDRIVCRWFIVFISNATDTYIYTIWLKLPVQISIPKSNPALLWEVVYEWKLFIDDFHLDPILWQRTRGLDNMDRNS